MQEEALRDGSDPVTPYILVNTFVPKLGCTDDFLAMQLDDMRRLAASARGSGWLGNEVYRAADGASVIVITRFVNRQAKEAWTRRPEFSEHLKRISVMLEDVRSVPATLVYVGRPD